MAANGWRQLHATYVRHANLISCPAGKQALMAPSSLPSLEYIRLIARIDAIENVLAGLYQKVNILLGVSPSQFEKQVEELRRELRGLVPPGLILLSQNVASNHD
jgi:hypothetical protein